MLQIKSRLMKSIRTKSTQKLLGPAQYLKGLLYVRHLVHTQFTYHKETDYQFVCEELNTNTLLQSGETPPPPPHFD